MKITRIIIPILFFSISCSQNRSIMDGSVTSLGVDPNSPGGSGATYKASTNKVEAVTSQRQFFPSIKKCLGLADSEVSSASQTAFTQASPSLPPTGNVQDLSAPMMMSVLKVAGELCNDLIKKEKNLSQKTFFTDFNLSGSTPNSSPNLSSTVQVFANRCWGRAATTDEVSIITKSMATLNLTNSSAAALYLCSAAIGSIQPLRR